MFLLLFLSFENGTVISNTRDNFNKFITLYTSFVAQTVKNLRAMQETWIQSLGRVDALKKGMATHSSILAGMVPQAEHPGGLQSLGSQGVRQLSD